jgi:hypothetical protein
MSDDLNPEARRLVELARQARTPGEADKLRIAERLAVPLAAGIATGSAAATAKAGGLSLGAKLAALAAVGAVGAAVVGTQTTWAPESKPAPARMAPPPAPVAPNVAPSEPDAITPEQLPAPEPTPAPRAVAPSNSPTLKPADALAEEAALLHQAQAAWRAGQSAQALALANQHARRFPRSQLSSERDVLRVLSMCKLGQVQSAKQVGARLLKKAKGSPWYQSVAESCAGD